MIKIICIITLICIINLYYVPVCFCGHCSQSSKTGCNKENNTSTNSCTTHDFSSTENIIKIDHGCCSKKAKSEKKPCHQSKDGNNCWCKIKDHARKDLYFEHQIVLIKHFNLLIDNYLPILISYQNVFFENLQLKSQFRINIPRYLEVLRLRF